MTAPLHPIPKAKSSTNLIHLFFWVFCFVIVVGIHQTIDTDQAPQIIDSTPRGLASVNKLHEKEKENNSLIPKEFKSLITPEDKSPQPRPK